MNYHEILEKQIIIIIKTHLTIGRCDNYLPPLNDSEIDKFIKENNNQIQKTINNIIKDYKDESKLEALENICDGAIREYLFEYINMD